MARKATATRSEIEALLNKGLTQAEVAEILGLTRQGVNYHLRQTGGKPYKSPLAVALEHMPWQGIEGKFKDSTPYRRMANHLEYMATGGHGMSVAKLTKLSGWYRMLRDYNVVVVFDPTIPPRPGIKSGGFDYVPREESDNDLIVRANDHTVMTDEAYELWRLPDEEMWPSV